MVSLPPAPSGPPEPFPAGGVSGPPPAPPAGPLRRARSRRWIVALIVVAVLVVAGIVVALSRGSVDPAAEGTTWSPNSTATASVGPAPPAPASLKADAGSFKVALTWTSGDPNVPVSYWLVMRDGTSIGQTTGSKSAWTDLHAVPHSDYVYEVVGVGEDGQRSAAARARVRTPTAPPATSRLLGLFNVKLVETSHWGFSSFQGGPPTAGWTFKPLCAKGACDTRLTDSGKGGLETALARMPASYQGTVTVHALVTCGSTHVDTSLAFDLHVTQAGDVKGEWRATKFAGTLTQRTASQLGCVSSGVDYTIAGTLVH